MLANSGERIQEDFLDADGELVLYNGNPFSGIGFDLFPDGVGVEYETEYVEGFPHGWDRKWYKNGQLAHQIPCCYGVKHGEETRWFDNGAVKSTSKYEYGVNTESKVWNEKGELVEHFEISPESTNFAMLLDRREKGWDFPSL